MADPPRALAGLADAVRGVLDQAFHLQEALSQVLELLSDRAGYRESLILVRSGSKVYGASRGVAAELRDGILREVRDDPERFLLSEVPGAPSPPSRDALASLPGARHLQVLPFAFPVGEFAGALLLDADGSDPILRDLPGVLAQVAVSLCRLVELESLRRDAEGDRTEGAHLRTVLDSIPDPVVVLDEEGQLLLSNRRAEELFLSGPEDSPGRGHAVETNNLFFSAFQAKARLGGDESRELLLVDPEDGSDLLFEVSYARNPGGRPEREVHIHILRDITDLKRAAGELEDQYKRSVAAEAQARRESERLNVILANTGVPILVTNEWSEIMLMNHRGSRLFEAPESARGASPRVGRVRENGAKITGFISDFLLQPQQRREEALELVDPDGARTFPARAVLTKILNRRGEPTAVVCVIDDLSEEVEIQRLNEELKILNRELEGRVEEATEELSERNRELERQREELARASRLKTEFLAMMSHELRTPINSMMGYISLLREGVMGPLEEQQEGALDRLSGSSRHLLSLINDLLDLSKVEAGKVNLSFSTLDPRTFLDDLSETIRPMVEEEGLSFSLEVAEDVLPVRADPTRLRQVLLNLASNAVKFTSEGGVVVRASPGPRNGTVRFEVEDTGPGIREEDLEQIFEGFYQGDRFETRKHGGTGLGLTISRKLLTMMDGTLSVRTEPGEGSVFFADLPAAEGSLDAEGSRVPVGAERPSGDDPTEE